MKRIIKMLLAPFAVLSLALGVTISINSQKDVVGAEAAGVDTITGTVIKDSATDGATSTSYSNFTGLSLTSGAVYLGNTAMTTEGYVQMRSKNSNSGIVTSVSGGKITKVVATWLSSTADGRTINIYGKSTSYALSTDLYSSTTQGTLIGTITKGTSTELVIGTEYLYVGIRSASDALYVNLELTWSAVSSIPVSDVTLTKNTSTLIVGSSENLATGVEVLPTDATDKSLIWSSNNTSVVTVHPTSGLVTAVGVGSATVKAQSTNPSVFDECVYQVTARVLNSIAIKTAATKTTFKVGESFSSAGLVLTADYNSGPLDVSTGFTTNLDSKVFTTGDIAAGVVVTVTLEGKTVTYTIDVEAEPLAVQDLFFSEYVEGSSSNKYLEIYNPLSTSVNLANYAIRQYNNGAATPTYTLTLSGTLAPFDTYVIKNSEESLNVTADLSTKSSVMNFNGDDTLTIYNGSIEVDIFGQIGYDPGTAWTVGTVSTVDKTLVRKPSITRGDQVGGDSFDPADEWDSYPQNTITYLGDAANGAYVLAEYLMASDTADQCITKFTIAKNDYFLKLSSASATLFQNGTETTLVSARARYLAWAINQNENPYSAEPLSGSNFRNESHNNILMVVVFGSIGLTLILGYYFLKKKKIMQ